jgi:hypothetical protein
MPRPCLAAAFPPAPPPLWAFGVAQPFTTEQCLAAADATARAFARAQAALRETLLARLAADLDRAVRRIGERAGQ